MNTRTTWICFALLSLAAGCGERKPSNAWRLSDPAYVPFAVHDIVVSGSSRFVGLTVDERPPNEVRDATGDLPVYVLDLQTGDHRRLGPRGQVLSIGGDQFIYSDSERSSQAPTLLRGLETIRTFEIGMNNGSWWNPRAGVAIFETNWPKETEGFSALTLVNPATGTAETVSVKEPSELLGVCPATGNFYTERHLPNDELAADEYDAQGEFIATLRPPLAVYSSGCRYVLPFASIGIHGPDDWAVFEAGSRTKVMDFPWIEDGKTDLHWFRAWNPRHDNLMLMYSQTARTQMYSIAVLDVAKRAVVKSWPNPENGPPIRWSGDGESVVTLRDHHIAFESLGPEVLGATTK
jgi:hypothetical protein